MDTEYSSDWIKNLLHVSDCSRAEDITSKHLIGRVQKVNIDPDLCIVLQSEDQLKFLRKIPVARRIASMDSTGKLVQVPKSKKKYPAIMNYMLLVHDSITLQLEKPVRLVVNETISSRHDTYFIGDMLRKWKYEFLKVYPSENPRRLVNVLMLDMSWASVHGALDVLTHENVYEYSERVFRYAQGDDSAASRTFIGQCASHTMHRFCRLLKLVVKFPNSEIKMYTVCSFTLLVNCSDLIAFKFVVTHIYMCFIPTEMDEKVRDSIKIIQEVNTITYLH